MKKGLLGGIGLAVAIIAGLICVAKCSVRVPAGYIAVEYKMNGGISKNVLTQGSDKRLCRISETAWSQSTSELRIYPWTTPTGKRDRPTSGGTIRELTGMPKVVFLMRHL